LRSPAKRLAPFFSADVAPTRGTESDSLSAYWRRRELPARDVQEFQREIEDGLEWQPALTHNTPQRHRSSDTETGGEFGGNVGAFGEAF